MRITALPLLLLASLPATSLVSCVHAPDEPEPNEISTSSSELASLEQFGYGRFEVLGAIPTIAVYGVYGPGVNSNNTQIVAPLTEQQLRDMVFDRSRTPNLYGYVWENSSGRAWLVDEGTYRTDRPDAERALPLEERMRVLRNAALTQWLARNPARSLDQFDKNGDGQIGAGELLVVVHDNADTGPTGPWGASRGARCDTFERSTKPVCAPVGIFGGVGNPGFTYLAHEAMHTLGTPTDLYGVTTGMDDSVSLMGPSKTSSTTTFHLDPWNKMALGWLRPRIVDVRWSNWDWLPPAVAVPQFAYEEVILLYDESRGTNEFFLAEYRTRTTGRYGNHHDKDTTGSGLAVWRVNLGPDRVPVERDTMIRNSRVRQGEWHHFSSLNVQAGQRLVVTLSGAGDADLYVRWNGQPDTNTWDCASTSWTSTERCELSTSVAANVVISVRGYGAGRNDYHLEARGLGRGETPLLLLSAPDGVEGGNAFYTSGQVTPPLRWTDGSSTRTRLLVNPFPFDADGIGVNWSNDENYLLDAGFEWQRSRAIGWPWNAEGAITGIDLNLGFQLAGANNGFAWTRDTGWQAITQYVPVPTEDCYFRFSGWVRSSPNVTAGYFGVRDAATNQVLSEVPFQRLGAYTYLDVPVFTRCAAAVRPFVGYWGPGGDSWIQVDDLRLSRM